MYRRPEGFSNISSYWQRSNGYSPGYPGFTWVNISSHLWTAYTNSFSQGGGGDPKRCLYPSYERELSNPRATPDVEARKARVPTAYMMLEKSRGNLDHCSRGFRRACRRYCRIHHKSSSTAHQVCSVDLLQEIRNHL